MRDVLGIKFETLDGRAIWCWSQTQRETRRVGVLVMPSGAVPEGRGSPPQSKGVGLPGITRKRVGFPLKILFFFRSLIKCSPPSPPPARMCKVLRAQGNDRTSSTTEHLIVRPDTISKYEFVCVDAWSGGAKLPPFQPLLSSTFKTLPAMACRKMGNFQGVPCLSR